MPLRILHVTPYYRPAWAYGGIPRVATACAEAQAARGHAVTVWTTDAATDARLPRPAGLGPATPWDLETDGVLVRVFPNLSNRLAYRQGFIPLGLRTHAARHAARFDVAHLHAYRNLPGTWAASALTRAGVPYVLGPNGTVPNLERHRLAKRLFDAAGGRRTLEGAARLIAVTDAERRQLHAAGVGDDRIDVVPNPVDLREFESLPPPGRFREVAALGSGPLVVFLGKLTPRKRVDVVIEAFARLPGTRARLVIAGNDMGAGVGARSLAARLGVQSRVTFTGLLCGADRLAALVDADVVVYPSEHEIFGIVPLEALLCGTPVIVAGDSGCAEVVGSVGGGFVVPVGDASSLALAIAGVLADPGSWQELVGPAREIIRRRFGSATIAAALDEVYARALA